MIRALESSQVGIKFTEEKIIEWLKVGWSSPEDELKKEIEKLKVAPKYARGLPWQL